VPGPSPLSGVAAEEFDEQAIGVADGWQSDEEPTMFTRWVYANRYVAGAPEVLAETLLAQAAELLCEATASEPEGPAADGSHVVDLHARLAGRDVHKRVRVTVGVAHRHGDRVVLPISWHADPGRLLFPAFTGSLELEPLDSRMAQLSLAGSYGVPLGPLGLAADTALLHRMAQDVADAVVRALVPALMRAATAADAPKHVTGPRVGEPLRVADVMTSNPLVLDEGMPLRTAALLLFHGEISGAPVCTEAGELVGVLSERDLLAKEATYRFSLARSSRQEDRRRASRTAGEACTRPALTTTPDVLLTDAARYLLDEDVSRLVVVAEGRIAGILTRHDVLAALVREDADLELAVQRMVDDEVGPGLEVEVQAGEVVLRGLLRLRSDAIRLPEAVAAVDGVMTVDVSRVAWVDDDLVAAYPLPHL
jgi:CBS domain-containing protein